MRWAKIRKPKGFKRGVLRSKLELDVQNQLKKLTKGTKIGVEFETATLPYTVQKKYIPDFIITRRDGTVLYIEAKGWFRSEDRAKMLAVVRDNPSLDIRMLFGKDNLISKGSSTRYSEWCIRHSIPYAIGKVPKEWLGTV